MRSLANEDEHGNPGGLHCREFIRLITDTLVVRYNGPATLADFNNPVLVLRIIEKVIAMSLNRNPCVPKKRRELFAEIAISEEYRTQAARS